MNKNINQDFTIGKKFVAFPQTDLASQTLSISKRKTRKEKVLFTALHKTFDNIFDRHF